MEPTILPGDRIYVNDGASVVLDYDSDVDINLYSLEIRAGGAAALDSAMPMWEDATIGELIMYENVNDVMGVLDVASAGISIAKFTSKVTPFGQSETTAYGVAETQRYILRGYNAENDTAVGAITGTSSDTSGVTGVEISINNGTGFWNGTDFTGATEQFFATTSGDNFATWLLAFSPGGEISGVVSEVGPDVNRLAVGDRVVCSVGWGGMAERVEHRFNRPWASAGGTSICCARPAGPPPTPACEPLRVQRRVNCRGALVVAGQPVHVGIVHAGRITCRPDLRGGSHHHRTGRPVQGPQTDSSQCKVSSVTLMRRLSSNSRKNQGLQGVPGGRARDADRGAAAVPRRLGAAGTGDRSTNKAEA